MPDKEANEGYLRYRYRDLEPGSTDLDNKAYARYISAAPVTPLGHFELAVSSTPVGLPSIPADAKRVVLCAPGTVGFTYTDDGTAPSATHGMPIPGDMVFIYDSDPDANFRLWAASSVDVRIAYYG